MDRDHDEFDRFWAAYPRKTAKGKARVAFARARTKVTLERMLAALAWQREQTAWLQDGGRFIPHPATWLNQERWDDEPSSIPQMSARTVRTLKAIYGD